MNSSEEQKELKEGEGHLGEREVSLKLLFFIADQCQSLYHIIDWKSSWVDCYTILLKTRGFNLSDPYSGILATLACG